MGWEIITDIDDIEVVKKGKEESEEYVVVPKNKPDIKLQKFFVLKFNPENEAWEIRCDDLISAITYYNIERGCFSIRHLVDWVQIGDSAPISAIPDSFNIVEVGGEYSLQPGFSWWLDKNNELPHFNSIPSSCSLLLDTNSNVVRIVKEVNIIT